LRLGVPFKDADHEIEAAAGLTVAEIFEKHGEPEFRAGERRVITRLLTEPPHVLATGGGAYMDPTTRAAMRDHAFTIWLKAPVDLLLARVAKRPAIRRGWEACASNTWRARPNCKSACNRPLPAATA
jgi:shikimate kinase